VKGYRTNIQTNAAAAAEEMKTLEQEDNEDEEVTPKYNKTRHLKLLRMQEPKMKRIN